MDLCVWAWNKATVHRVGLWTEAKSNESCLWKITSKQMFACFFGKTGPVTTLPLEHRRTVNSKWYTTIFLLRRISKNEQEKTNHCSPWQCELAHIGSNQALLTGLNVELMGQPPYRSDLASNDYFYCRTSRKNAWSTIFVARRCCWNVQKSRFGVVSIGVEKQTQMMVVHQNILSSVMLKNDTLSNGNVRLQLATPEICQIRNSSINARINNIQLFY